MESNFEQDKVEYVTFDSLVVPGSTSVTSQQLTSALLDKFQSKDWRKHFEALTELRAINKHRSDVYINSVLPNLLKDVAGQVDNLRSNNSKQALTLLNETIKYNKIGSLSNQDIGLIVSKLFTKSCSEKGFLKSEAREAITGLQTAEHPALIVELSQQTQAPNYQISELAVLTLKNSLVKKAVSKENLASEEFLKLLVRNLHGKRALIEKTSKQILTILDKTYTTEGLTALVSGTNLSQEERDTITTELTNIKKAGTSTKTKGSLKDFLKMKQQQGGEGDKMQVE